MTEFVRSLQPGDVIANRYNVQRCIAKFGVNDIHAAYDARLERIVDLFSVRVPPSSAHEIEASLRHDLKLAQRVQHPNVWQLYSYAPDMHGGVIIAEHLEGQSLHSFIRARHKSGGFSAATFRSIAQQLCAGLAAIHAAGIVHADVKPGRVQVDGDRVVLRLFEFGEELTLLESAPSAPHGGTPNYMSPERLANGRPNFMDDVYALGLTLLEVWTRRVPNPGENPRNQRLRPQVAIDPCGVLERDEVRQLFRMVHEDPTKRPHPRETRWGTGKHMEVPADHHEETLFTKWITYGGNTTALKMHPRVTSHGCRLFYP